MIVVFHFLAIILRQIIIKRKREKALEAFKVIKQFVADVNSQSATATNYEEELTFDPPVYRQRYGTVYNLLLNAKWRKDIRKIVDFGSAELGLFVFLKSLLSLNEICFVDIDEELLNQNVTRVFPLTIDHLKRRAEPLKVNVFAGSIVDPDIRILDADAVLGIEIIEHLYPDVLDAFPYNIFFNIQPRIAIFTTPNSEFNVLFPNPAKFRHDDHKFEWTRKQFECWGNNVIERFPDYCVTFSGVGFGPKGTEHLGCCTQLAIFVRKDYIIENYKISVPRCLCSGDMQCGEGISPELEPMKRLCLSCFPKESYGVCTHFSYTKTAQYFDRDIPKCSNKLQYYKLIKSIDYPFEVDERTPQERMLDDIKYKINTIGTTYGRFFNEERLRSEIPLSELTYGPDGQFITVPELESLFSALDYKLEECQVGSDEEPKMCLIYEPGQEEDPHENDSVITEINSSEYPCNNEEVYLSDWDNDTQENAPKEAKDIDEFPPWLMQELGPNFTVQNEPRRKSCSDLRDIGLEFQASGLSLDMNSDSVNPEFVPETLQVEPEDYEDNFDVKTSTSNVSTTCDLSMNSAVSGPEVSVHIDEAEEFFDSSDDFNAK